MAKWYHPTTDGEIRQVPWLGEAVITRISEIINKDFSVIEYGSGGSTLWFQKRVKFLMSVENNKKWYDKVREALEAENKVPTIPNNVALIFNAWPAPPDNWMEYPAFDLLMIDGEPVEERALWINECRMMVKKGGWIVLDNANRPEYENERNFLHSISQSVETFDCNEGTRYLVTDICRLK